MQTSIAPSPASQNNLPLPAPASPDGSIEGRVTRIVYEANTGTMRVFTIEDDDRRPHTVKQFANSGQLSPLAVKDQVRVLGKFVNDARFGRQFVAEDIVRRTATTAEGVAKVISGKAFKGIGAKLANKLVDQLGQNLPDILNRGDPGELITTIIGPKKARLLVDAWLADQAVHMTDATLSANRPFLAVSLCFKIIQKQWFSAFGVFRVIALRCDPLQIRVGKGVGKEKWASSRPTCFEDRLSQGAITMATVCS